MGCPREHPSALAPPPAAGSARVNPALRGALWEGIVVVGSPCPSGSAPLRSAGAVLCGRRRDYVSYSMWIKERELFPPRFMERSHPVSPAMDEEVLPQVFSRPLDLSLQTESYQDERELRGLEFSSWEEFSTFFDAWCELKNAVFNIRDFILLSKCEWAAAEMSPEAAASLRYSYVRLNCRESRKSKKPEKRERKLCSSMIAVRLNHKKDRLVVAECKFTHSHVLCPLKFKHHFKKGHLLAMPSKHKHLSSTTGNLPAHTGYPSSQAAYPSSQVAYPSSQAAYCASQVAFPHSQAGYLPSQAGYPPSAARNPPSQGGCPTSQAGYLLPKTEYAPLQPGLPTSQAKHRPEKTGRRRSKAAHRLSQAMLLPLSQSGHNLPPAMQLHSQAGHSPSSTGLSTSQALPLPSHVSPSLSQVGQPPSQTVQPSSQPPSQTVQNPSRVMRRSTQAVRLSSQGMRQTNQRMRQSSQGLRQSSQAVRRNARVARLNARAMRTSKKIAKQFLGNHDIRRLLSSCKGRNVDIHETLTALDGLFAGDPASKVKVTFVKNNVIIQTVFFQTSLMRSLCQRFPETLVFDRMMGFNEEFALFTLLCIDANGRGRECAFCLTRKGTPDLLRFTLLSLVQSIPEVKSKVKSVMVGVRVTEPGVVQEFMPNAQVQICRLEVLGALLNKIQEIGSAQDEKSWPLLCDLASSKSSEAYDQTLERMEVSFSRDFIRYFEEQWHPWRKMWVACWGPETQQVTRTLIRQHQQKLVSGLSPSPTLGQCILELVAMQAPKVDLENLNGEEVAACYRSVCNPEPARMIEGELGVTGHGSYSIQGTEEGYTLGDGTSKYLLDQKLTTCSCPFHTSSLLPCRHLFVIRFRTGETLFDVNLLQKSTLIKTLQQ